MGEIKSALELALERTSGIEADREAFSKAEAIKQGKKIGSLFLSDKKVDLREEIEKSGEKEAFLVVGIIETLMSSLKLPASGDEAEIRERIREGLVLFAEDRDSLVRLFQQLESFFSDYLAQIEQVKEMLKAQYGPKLQEKADQFREQTGVEFSFDAEKDPEFIAILNEQLGGLKNRARQLLDQGKEQIQQTLK